MTTKTENHAFERWLKKGTSEYRDAIRVAIDVFQPFMESNGFEWVEKCPDRSKPQVNSMEFHRKNADGNLEMVIFLFDKNQRYRFQVFSMVKEDVEPYRWIKAGDIVRFQSELDKARWWEVKWWQMNKPKAFRVNVEKISKLLPSLIEFLKTDKTHPNLWVHSLE